MSRTATRELFVRALRSRKIANAEAARICGTSKDTFERVANGSTSKISADWIRAIADHLAPGDRETFLREIFPVGPGAARAGFGAFWIAADGTAVPSPDGLVAEARRRLGTPGESMGDVRAFVARGYGWVGLEPIAGEGARVTLDRRRVDLRAARALVEWIDARPPAFARVDDGCGWRVDSNRLTPGELAALARRVLRARVPLPDGWIDAELPLSELTEELRAILDNGLARALSRNFTTLLDTGRASLFAIDQGEAVCLHIGSSFDVPTRPWIGRRVLDRDQHVAFAAMVDRHAVAAAANDAPVAREVQVDFGDRWTRYRKLALPFRVDGSRFVLTASSVLRESRNRPQ